MDSSATRRSARPCFRSWHSGRSLRSDWRCPALATDCIFIVERKSRPAGDEWIVAPPEGQHVHVSEVGTRDAHSDRIGDVPRWRLIAYSLWNANPARLEMNG